MAGVPKTEFVLNENTNRNFFEKKATRKKYLASRVACFVNLKR
jgi:hypothetical protein